MLDLSEFRVLDRNSDACGVSVSKLMENAGSRIAEFVKSRKDGRSNVLVVCGPGNNGGDGLVAAAKLRGKAHVHIMLVGGRKRSSDLLKSSLSKVKALIADSRTIRRLKPSDMIVVDALLGSGANRPPMGDYLDAIELMEGLRRDGSILVSVDVPSGFPTGVQVHPDYTVTFHDAKRGMTERECGKITIADIGIPERAVKYTGPGEMHLYPVPMRETHKGNNGTVTVIGGGSFSGAPTFSSMGAYRTGADLVYTIVPSRSYHAVSGFSPNLMAFSSDAEVFSPSDAEMALHWIRRSGAVVIGPGMDTGESTLGFIAELLRRVTCPAVVDATAIEAVGADHKLLKGGAAVVTPHAREFETLTGEKTETALEARAEQIRCWASRLGATILLKGSIDIISDGIRVKLNDTGNPGMTVGGTGDVLTGIVACLLSKGCAPFDAARLGAYLNGSAGDLSFAARSYGLLATDVIEHIPDVLVRDIRENR